MLRRFLKTVFKFVFDFYFRWRDTKLFFRVTVDDFGREFMYEFALVPRRQGDFYLRISQLDRACGTTALVERTITASDFEKLRPSLLEYI